MVRTSKWKRRSLQLPEELDKKVIEYADELDISINSAYSILARQALESQDLQKQIPSLIYLMQETLKNNSSNN